MYYWVRRGLGQSLSFVFRLSEGEEERGEKEENEVSCYSRRRWEVVGVWDSGVGSRPKGENISERGKEGWLRRSVYERQWE